MFLTGTVLTSVSLTQKVGGSNNLSNRKYILSRNSMKTFRENSDGWILDNLNNSGSITENVGFFVRSKKALNEFL